MTYRIDKAVELLEKQGSIANAFYFDIKLLEEHGYTPEEIDGVVQRLNLAQTKWREIMAEVAEKMAAFEEEWS